MKPDAIYEYKSKNGSGNLHDAARYANAIAPDGWRLVVAEASGYNWTAIFERKVEPK